MRTRSRQSISHSRGPSPGLSDSEDVHFTSSSSASSSNAGLAVNVGASESPWENRLRTRMRFTLGDSRAGSASSSHVNYDFNEELTRLREQNLLLKRGRTSPLRANTASCMSSNGSSSSRSSVNSARSCPQPIPTPTPTDPPDSLQPLSTLSLLPRMQRMAFLETLVKAFPVTISTEEFDQFVDSSGHPDITGDMKRYFMERKDRHKNQFNRSVNVFKSARPWEPKWFTSVFNKLLVSTKARPDIYQYVFEMRQREEESKVLQKWKSMRGYIKWTLVSLALLFFFIILCFLIEIYGEEGVNISVPVILFTTIVLNKILINMNSELPIGE